MTRLPPAFVIAVALVLLLVGKSALLQPPAVSADRFDAAEAMERLARMIGTEGVPHATDTDASDLVRSRLIEEVRALGYEPRLSERWSCNDRYPGQLSCAFVRNIVFRAGPEGGGALLLSAHYDGVPAGPGAADAGIAVATLLEVAQQVQGRDLPKPIIFLLNDGEELGLLGAYDFVRNDPARADVDLVLNMEARGVRGPVMMFETSTPNGSPVDLFAQVPGFKVSNSVMTDLYKLLPNDTDVTAYLPAGYRALNLAITEGVEAYHTEADNLQNLSALSVGHMGSLATGVVEAFMAEGEVAPDRSFFTDLWGRAFIKVPPALPVIVIISVMIAGAIVFIRSGGGGFASGALAPVVAMITGSGLGFAGFLLLDLFREELAFWTALPWPTQLLLYVPAIVGASTVMALALARSSARRLVAASFFWTGLLWLLLIQILPGASVMLFLPGLLMVASLVIGSLRQDLFGPSTAVAGAVSAFLLTAIVWQLEVGMNFQAVGASSFLASLFAVLALTPILQRGDMSRFVKTGIVVTGLAFIAGTLVPAYTVFRPGHATFKAIQASSGNAYLDATRTDPFIRKLLEDVGPFEVGPMDDFEGERFRAPIAFDPLPAPNLSILSEEPTELGRKVRLSAWLNGADAINLYADESIRATALHFGGRTFPLDPEERFSFNCTGRSCDGAELELVLSGEGNIRVLGFWYDLPAEVQPFASGLPKGYSPVHRGNQTYVIRNAQL